MKNKKIKIPELLAPAGSLAAGLTAFDYGADAVYAGLQRFNARERTENFSLEEMSKLITYAHTINKKVYVTFNTLIKESELEEVAEQLYEISCLKPDAVIVQDIGVLRIIREYFPSLRIHASTQMGIHNSAGVNFASKLGIKRVILERQVSSDELKEIVKNSNIETEIFVHGALCCSMSGNCLLSSWLGGWSGNRGKCKQPCRRRYYGSEGNGFFFSTKDLYSLDVIQELKQTGINSLKIEGRLRKSDYLKNVVSAYRMILDAPPNEDSIAVLKKARNTLSRSLGRKWSAGFRNIDSCRDVIQHKLLGVSGQPCGKVLKTAKSGFSVALAQRIHIGDRVRIQPKSGDEGPTLTITKLSANGKSVNKASKDNECFVHCDKEIPQDGIVYKIGESGGDHLARIAKLPVPSNDIDLSISIDKTGLSVVPKIFASPEPDSSDKKISSQDGTDVSKQNIWNKKIALADAIKQSLSKETVVKEFRASNSNEYKAGKIDVSIHGNLFIPASELKKARREFWIWFISNISREQLTQDSLEGLQKFRKAYHNPVSKQKFTIEQSVLLQEGKNNPLENTIKVNSLEDFDRTTDEIQLPTYCFEYNLNNTSRKIRAAVKKGHKKFRVTSLYGFELLKDHKGVQISTSFPLPICNSSAAFEIKSICAKAGFKLSKTQAWIELEKNEIEQLLKKSPTQIEIYTYGRPYLLITRAFIPANGVISDSKGSKFVLIKDKKNGLALLYADKVLSIPVADNVSVFLDLSNAKVDEKNTSTFNYDYTML